MCILYNQRDATYTVFFIIISAMHISGSFPTHHQELLKLCSLGYCHAFLLSTAGVVGVEPRLHIQFYKLLMMDAKIARNMQSADNNKEHCISCISLVI